MKGNRMMSLGCLRMYVVGRLRGLLAGFAAQGPDWKNWG